MSGAFDPELGTGSGSDHAPGEPQQLDREVLGGELRSYLLGLALALLLTAASFWALHTHLIYGPGIMMAIVVLAVAQMGIHLVFFLHLTSGPDNTNNVLALAFGVLVVFLIIGGSIWILSNLNANMMPMADMPG